MMDDIKSSEFRILEKIPEIFHGGQLKFNIKSSVFVQQKPSNKFGEVCVFF